MVYGAYAMLPVEIDMPTWRRENFSEEGKQSFQFYNPFCLYRFPKVYLKFFLLKINSL